MIDERGGPGEHAHQHQRRREDIGARRDWIADEDLGGQVAAGAPAPRRRRAGGPCRSRSARRAPAGRARPARCRETSRWKTPTACAAASAPVGDERLRVGQRARLEQLERDLAAGQRLPRAIHHAESAATSSAPSRKPPGSSASAPASAPWPPRSLTSACASVAGWTAAVARAPSVAARLRGVTAPVPGSIAACSIASTNAGQRGGRRVDVDRDHGPRARPQRVERGPRVGRAASGDQDQRGGHDLGPAQPQADPLERHRRVLAEAAQLGRAHQRQPLDRAGQRRGDDDQPLRRRAPEQRVGLAPHVAAARRVAVAAVGRAAAGAMRSPTPAAPTPGE
ncbi:MAG: hypothetical protein IPH80_33950 [Myxococcales bacterium]|nr:hypothetical protein [Myxococcales bacterium]